MVPDAFFVRDGRVGKMRRGGCGCGVRRGKWMVIFFDFLEKKYFFSKSKNRLERRENTG